MYKRQPQSWATWVAHQSDRYDDGLLVNAPDFLNSAAIKPAKIVAKEKGFHGSVNSVRDDIVAMVTATKPKKAPSKKAASSSAGDSKPSSRKRPPFLRHYKSSPGDDGTPYVVGDSKTWNNSTWYFCDCPNHRDRIKWHTFPASECNVRRRWLEGQAAPQANLSQEPDDATSAAASVAPSSIGGTTVDSAANLLADAYGLLGDNSDVQVLIADALASLSSE